MKKYFKKQGFQCSWCGCQNRRDFDKAVKTIGFPMIAKPDNGVGASGTFKLKKADFDPLKKPWDGQTAYFFEKFVNSNYYQPMMAWWIARKCCFRNRFNLCSYSSELMLSRKDNAYFIEKELDQN